MLTLHSIARTATDNNCEWAVKGVWQVVVTATDEATRSAGIN